MSIVSSEAVTWAWSFDEPRGEGGLLGRALRSLPDRLLGRLRGTLVRKLSVTFDEADALALIDDLFRFEDYSAVTDLLKIHPYLFGLLLEAYLEIQDAFPVVEQLILTVVSDPESEGDNRLFLFIHAPIDPETAYDALQQLDNYWWIDAAARSHCQLTIDIEYSACSPGVTF